MLLYKFTRVKITWNDPSVVLSTSQFLCIDASDGERRMKRKHILQFHDLLVIIPFDKVTYLYVKLHGLKAEATCMWHGNILSLCVCLSPQVVEAICEKN